MNDPSPLKKDVSNSSMEHKHLMFELYNSKLISPYHSIVAILLETRISILVDLIFLRL